MIWHNLPHHRMVVHDENLLPRFCRGDFLFDVMSWSKDLRFRPAGEENRQRRFRLARPLESKVAPIIPRDSA